MIVATVLYRHNPDGSGTLEQRGAFRYQRDAEEVAAACNSSAEYDRTRERWFVEVRGFVGRVELYRDAREWFEANDPTHR